jgi:hypothetical protein
MIYSGIKKRAPGKQLFGDSPWSPPKEDLLLLYSMADVKAIFERGKRYPWPRPQHCPKCKGQRLWGHGYAARYFEGFMEPLWVKRYRCPDCQGVHTYRPSQYFERYRHTVAVVIVSVLNKIMHDRWVRCISRQNQLWWYRSVWAWCSRQQAVAKLEVEHLRQYVSERVSGSIQREPLRM